MGLSDTIKSAMILMILMVGILMMTMIEMNLPTWMRLVLIIMILMFIILAVTIIKLQVCVLRFNLI